MSIEGVLMSDIDWDVLNRMSLRTDAEGRYVGERVAVTGGVMVVTDELDPTELPDDEIIPDETRPLEDEPVKTDQVPEE